MGREALLRPAHDAVTLIPLCTCILCALCVELPRRRTVQKGTNKKIKNGRKRDPCSWSELANKHWGSGDLCWSFYLANWFFFLISV